jgi:signal transduction histidine kinase
VISPGPFLVDLALVAAFVVAGSLALAHRDRPGAVPFVLLSVLLAAMAVGIAVGRSSALERWTPFLLFAPFVFASLAWLALAFEYTGRGPVVTRRRAAGLAAFGIAVVGITVLSTVVPDPVLQAWTLLINVLQLGLITAVGYGMVLVARSGIGYGDLPRSGSLVLTTAGGGLLAVTVVQLLAPAIPYETAFTLSEGILAVIAVLLLLTQVRYRVFDSGPSAGHLARETALDEMAAAVAITGREGGLLDFNRTAERTFDIAQPDALGDPIDEALGVDPDSTGGGPVSIETSEGRRRFELERSELTSRSGEPVGWAYLLRDVTERRTHEQRLDVLNRVLRHNLRNDLDAIRGFAEALEHGDPDSEPAGLAARIRGTADDLAALGETLSRGERLLEAGPIDPELVDVDALLRRVAGTIRERYPDASVTTRTADGTTVVRTDRQILETVLAETIENGIEHNDSEPPRVEIVVQRGDSGVVVEVRDDGPGIPEQELSVLLEGTETPLRHGSGLGLWLVYWGVVRLGGDLEFREREPRGSTVSVRLPDR